MFASIALLVERGRIPEVDAEVDRLGEELGPGIRIRYVGPLPPYSFATLEGTEASAWA